MAVRQNKIKENVRTLNFGKHSVGSFRNNHFDNFDEKLLVTFLLHFKKNKPINKTTLFDK